MKKQSGFTLIELMVVMAIIAILATAGLSAYTGYIKKARDTTRIADLGAINTIILASMSTSGLVPGGSSVIVPGDVNSGDPSPIQQVIRDANNGKGIVDPLSKGGGPVVQACLRPDGLGGFSNTGSCFYVYTICDGGTGYAIGAYFESRSNLSLYDENASGDIADLNVLDYDNGQTAPTYFYDLGSCRNTVDAYPWWLDTL